MTGQDRPKPKSGLDARRSTLLRCFRLKTAFLLPFSLRFECNAYFLRVENHRKQCPNLQAGHQVRSKLKGMPCSSDQPDLRADRGM